MYIISILIFTKQIIFQMIMNDKNISIRNFYVSSLASM